MRAIVSGDLLIHRNRGEFVICDTLKGRALGKQRSLANALVTAHRAATIRKVNVWTEESDGTIALIYEGRE